MPCFGLHPQGFTVSSYPVPAFNELSHAPVAFLARRLGRFITKNRPCRFCAIAMTLATHTCIWLRAQQVGGLSSAAFLPPSAALSLSYYYTRAHYLLLMEVLSREEGALAVQLARATLENKICGIKMPSLPLTKIFNEKRGVFVTLTKKGDLRGCIGFPTPVYPLQEAIEEAAVSAALQDPRFYPVAPQELCELRVEVTILTVPCRLDVEPARRPDAVEAGKHGLIVRKSGRSGLLLPQVPREFGWNSREFLDHTCIKAGLPAGCWQSDDTEIYTFEGQIFHEQES